MIYIDESGWGCERIDADILTNNGWKSYNQLNNTDKVLTYLDNGDIKWTHFTKKFSYDFNGKINHLFNVSSDIAVTDNHHFKVLKRITKGNAIKHTAKVVGYKSYYVPFKELVDNDNIPRTGNWEGKRKEYFILPKIKKVKYDGNNYKNIKIPMNDWLAFLGLWIAEGCATKIEEGGYFVCISQKPGAKAKIIKRLLKRLPFKFKYDNKINFVTCNKQLWTYLAKFGKCYDKYIPNELLDLSKEQLRILFNWLILGDGNKCYTHNKTSLHVDYYTTSIRLKDNFQELSLKLGYSFTTRSRKRSGTIRGRKITPTCPCYEISIRKGKYIHVGNLKLKKESYRGKVFDLTVPEGKCFYVRRNGIGYFTGNSLLGGVAIGMYSDANKQFYYDIIPVSFFSNRKFKTKEYLTEALKIVLDGLDEMSSGFDNITICSGYILSKVRENFTRHKIKYKTGEIGEPLQTLLEAEFSKHLISFGVKPKSDGAHCLSFDDQLNWVKQRKTRKKYVKTGWNSWKNKYSKLGIK